MTKDEYFSMDNLFHSYSIEINATSYKSIISIFKNSKKEDYYDLETNSSFILMKNSRKMELPIHRKSFYEWKEINNENIYG